MGKQSKRQTKYRRLNDRYHPPLEMTRLLYFIRDAFYEDFGRERTQKDPFIWDRAAARSGQLPELCRDREAEEKATVICFLKAFEDAADRIRSQ